MVLVNKWPQVSTLLFLFRLILSVTSTPSEDQLKSRDSSVVINNSEINSSAKDAVGVDNSGDPAPQSTTKLVSLKPMEDFKLNAALFSMEMDDGSSLNDSKPFTRVRRKSHGSSHSGHHSSGHRGASHSGHRSHHGSGHHSHHHGSGHHSHHHGSGYHSHHFGSGHGYHHGSSHSGSGHHYPIGYGHRHHNYISHGGYHQPYYGGYGYQQPGYRGYQPYAHNYNNYNNFNNNCNCHYYNGRRHCAIRTYLGKLVPCDPYTSWSG